MADDQRPSAKTEAAKKPEPARFSPEEFDVLVESGVAAKLGRFELRGGELYRMNAECAPHMRMKMALIFALKAAVEKIGEPLEIGSEGTVKFGRFMPLSDVLLFTSHTSRGPVPGKKVRLIVEVADTTLADDLGAKRDLYAEVELAEYWVVDMSGGVILQHAAPRDGAFTRSKTIARGFAVESLTLPGLRIDTASLPWDVS